MSALTSSWTPRILSLLRIVTGYLLLTHGTAKILGFPKVEMFANLQIASMYGVAGVLELILVRLIPELSEKGVGELWEERLG